MPLISSILLTIPQDGSNAKVEWWDWQGDHGAWEKAYATFLKTRSRVAPYLRSSGVFGVQASQIAELLRDGLWLGHISTLLGKSDIDLETMTEMAQMTWSHMLCG